MTHKKLAWASAVKIWNKQNAWSDDMYALPKKAGQYYQDIVDIIAEYGGPKPVVPEPVALPEVAPVVVPVVAPVVAPAIKKNYVSEAEVIRFYKEKQQKEFEEIERKKELLKKQNESWADKTIEFWKGKADHIKRQTDFYKDIREWRQLNQNKILISLASDLSEEEFVKTAGKYFNSDKDAKAFHAAVFVEHGVDYPSVDIIDSKPKFIVSEKQKEEDPNELTAEEQRQINTSIFNSRMAKEERKKNSEILKSVIEEKPKTPEPPAKESEEVYGLTPAELKLREVKSKEHLENRSGKAYHLEGKGAILSHLPTNQIKQGFNWLKSKWGSLYEETKSKIKRLQDSGDFSKANRKKITRIDFDSEEQRKEYFMDLYFADSYVWEALNFNIVKAPAIRRPEGEFKRWNK